MEHPIHLALNLVSTVLVQLHDRLSIQNGEGICSKCFSVRDLLYWCHPLKPLHNNLLCYEAQGNSDPISAAQISLYTWYPCTTKVIANAIFNNLTTERFLEIQVEVAKFKTFEIKNFRNLNLAYLAKIFVSKITSYTVCVITVSHKSGKVHHIIIPILSHWSWPIKIGGWH